MKLSSFTTYLYCAVTQFRYKKCTACGGIPSQGCDGNPKEYDVTRNSFMEDLYWADDEGRVEIEDDIDEKHDIDDAVDDQ